MTPTALRVLEHVHGHLGWLTVVVLLHPVIVLRRPGRRAPLAVSLATALPVVTGVLGGWIYPEYRVRLKQQIFLDAPTLGWCFERKEHLAVFAISLACAGCVAHLAAPRFPVASRELVSRAAHRAYSGAFLLALVAAALGTSVAVFRTF